MANQKKKQKMTEIVLFNRAKAAEYLGISPNTLAQWATERPMRIPMVKIGSRSMYRKSDLDAFITEKVQGV